MGWNSSGPGVRAAERKAQAGDHRSSLAPSCQLPVLPAVILSYPFSFISGVRNIVSTISPSLSDAVLANMPVMAANA